MNHINYSKTIQCSFAQEQLWFVDKHSNGMARLLNEPVVLMLRGVDCVALERSCNKLLETHFSLRAVFVETDEGVFKKLLITNISLL